jgi:hypothetical protein
MTGEQLGAALLTASSLAREHEGKAVEDVVICVPTRWQRRRK